MEVRKWQAGPSPDDEEPRPGITELTTCHCTTSECKRTVPARQVPLHAQRHVCVWQMKDAATLRKKRSFRMVIPVTLRLSDDQPLCNLHILNSLSHYEFQPIIVFKEFCPSDVLYDTDQTDGKLISVVLYEKETKQSKKSGM